MAYKGKFTPKNPKKYKGDPTKIVYRSMWEVKFMQFLDDKPEIVNWSSEEISITYLSPVDGRVHRYFPDFWVRKINTEGKLECAVIDIKPEKQTLPPQQPIKKSARYINEVVTYTVNQAKFQAAQSFCEDRNWRFMVLTEKDLGIRY